MRELILVINPNSTQAITDQMSVALSPFHLADGPQFVCETLASGPPGIETQAHVDAATGQLLAWFEAEPGRRTASAVVVACFSDPGVIALRQTLAMPVLGIGEASYLTAVALGERIGIVSAVPASIARHRRALRMLGLDHRLAGDIALDMPVARLTDETATWDRLCAVATRLREEHGADAIVMGCAGLVPYRRRLEERLAIPIIDPVQAGAGLALGVVLARRRKNP